MKTLDLAKFGVFLQVVRCEDPRVGRLALAALGAALGLYAIGLAIWEPGVLTLPLPVHLAIGWSFVAAGLVAWEQRPENRLGLLMMLSGIVWFGRDFDWFGSWTADHASELSQNLFLALLVHEIVVFPYGVTRSRLERWLVIAAYALAVLAYLVPLAIYILVDRWLKADPAERRALRPLVLVGPPVLVVVALSIAVDYIGVSLTATGEAILDWCALVYTAIPLAFLSGVLRTRLHRALMGRLLHELSVGASFEDDALQAAAEAARKALREERPLPNLEQLTTREIEVLALLAEGKTDRGIAQELYVTPKTVEAHVRSIFRKLELPTGSSQNRRVHAVLMFMRTRTP
jgi:DNA-binding CsgD family transcriptional regulator